MKAILKPIGDFMLIDPQTHEVLWPNRGSVMVWTEFLAARTGSGQIEVLASNLDDTASDDEFLAFVVASNGNQDLAVASYISSLNGPAVEGDDRTALEQTAVELGVKFRSNTSTVKLQALVDTAKALV